MKYSNLFVLLGILAVGAYGSSLRSRRQAQDGNDLEDRYGGVNYPTQFQYPSQAWNLPNPPAPGQPWNYPIRGQLNNPVYPYPDLSQMYPGVPFNPRQPFNPGQQFYPGQPFNPGPPFNPGQPFNPVQPFNPIQPFNPRQPFNPVQPFNPIQPFNPAQPNSLGPVFNPSQTWNPGNEPTEPSLDVTSMPNFQSQSSSSTTTENINAGEDIAVADCLRTCPVTTEYNPVCGSDNVTYDNPGRLECAKLCGKSIEMLRKSRCPK